MTENIETSLLPIEKSDYLFVATKPSEMVNAQEHLIEWFTQKTKLLNIELREVMHAFDIAKKNKWAISTLRNQVFRIKGTKLFYEKCLSALNAGFYLIPDFPIETFAIRTNKKKPNENYSKSSWPQREGQKAENNLAENEGDYVSPTAQRAGMETLKEIKDGKEINVEYFWDSNFKEVQFPIIALKPEIMNETAQALMLKLFDEVGICPRQKAKDPMIIGRILGPKLGYAQRSLSFLIAWYIDIRDL